MKVAAGVDIGGTKLAAGLVSEHGELLDLVSRPTDTRTPEAPALQALALVRGMAGSRQLAGVGVGVPGLPRTEAGGTWAPNLPGWENFPLAAVLRAQFPGSRVAVENDGKCAALGEAWVGAGAGAASAALMVIGTGIGGGVIIGGRVVTGFHGVSGAFGWLPDFQGHTLPVRGARIGPLERVAAGPALNRAATGLGQPHAAALFKAARTGNASAMEVVRQFAWRVAGAISAIVAVVDPEVLILGGGVSDNFDVFEPPLQEALGEVLHPFATRLRVVPARLGSRAGILGAARLILHPYSEEESK